MALSATEPLPAQKPARLVSLDAYRGFIMFILASTGFGIAETAKRFTESPIWSAFHYQFDHTAWTGCSFWDLIQPSFMFMVGVAMPYSYASRRARGDSERQVATHAAVRSIVLVLLGIFLSSNTSKQTDFTFVNVLTQIGLGYMVVYLLLGRGFLVQLLAIGVVLGGYWLSFFLYPAPGAGQFFSGLAAHWDKQTNFAAWVDRWFLNLFPRPKEFMANEGGYQTLNFVPSIATMVFGLMAGEFLRSQRTARKKFVLLALVGLACLLIGVVIDHTIWPGWLADRLARLAASLGMAGQSFFRSDWTLCPIVKRIWTPSWAIFSSGWTLLMLAAFFGVIDLVGYKRWAFPLVIVGMNSIAVYCMWQLLKSWIGNTLEIHFGWIRQYLWTAPNRVPRLFEGTYGPMAEYTCVGLVIWLICWWMYRQKIFIRI